MITEKGKAFIARNFGVNNCYTLEDVVSCTVYSKGAPSERVLDTPTIVFLLVTDIVDWVRTSTGRFTLADLVAANEGNYISMSEALDITAYCIPGAAPPTAPIAPLTTPAAKITKAGIITELRSKGAIDIAAVSTVPAANKWYMYYRKLNYHDANFEKVIEISNLQTRNPPTQVADIALSENRTSVSELDRDWVLARIGELPYAAATVPYVPLTTPPGTSKDIEILNPSVTCDSQNCDVKFDLKNNSSSGSAYVRLEVDGVPRDKRYVYILTGATKPQVLSTSITGLSSGYHNLTIAVGTVVDTDMYTHRFHVGIGIEPPAAAAKITKAGIITELRSKGAIDIAAVSTAPGDNKWFMYNSQLMYQLSNLAKAITIAHISSRNPPTQESDIQLLENRTSVSELDRDWVLARIGELPYAAPPVTPPVTPPITKLPAPTNIRVTYLRPDYAYVEWNGVLECCSYPDEQREYCGCEFGITLNGVPTKVFSDPHPGLDCEELTPGTRYTLEIQTRSPPDIYSYREPSEKVLFTFTTPIAPLTTPAAKITKAGIITELRSKGAIDIAAVSTAPGDNKWFMYNSQLMYQLSNLAKAITIAHISSRNPPTQESDIQLLENRTSVSELDRDWVLARIGELPFKAPVTPPTAASLSAPEFIAEIRKRGTLDLARISMIPGDNKWFKFAGQLVYRVTGGKSGIVITSPGKSNMYAAFSKNEATVTRVETNWAMARIGELPFTAPPAAPPATAVEPPEAIKAWIVRNYGDGTRVTADGWRKLNVAKMANALASLPAGYTGADITEGVVLWAQTNPNWETKTICGWISSIGVTKLTEDHGLYIYNSAVGWTTLADRIYGTLTPKPSKPSAGIVTVDNGLGVYDYAIGWTTIANRITRCNF